MDLYTEEMLTYPIHWEEEYKSTGRVKCWRQSFPDQFEEGMGSTRLGTLDLFPQYALMFLLRNCSGIHSITWYELANPSKTSKNILRRRKYWEIMRRVMGEDRFSLLQAQLHENGFTSFKGKGNLTFSAGIHRLKNGFLLRLKEKIDCFRRN